MSLREIANHARVSTATVSRVINGVPTVNRNLAKRVRKAIGKHGYSGNTQARCLVSGKSRLFGLVISDMRDPFFPEIVQSFEAAAIEFGCETLVTSTLHDPKRIEHSLEAAHQLDRDLVLYVRKLISLENADAMFGGD